MRIRLAAGLWTKGRMMTDRELLELAAKAHGGIPERVIGAKPGLYAIDEPLMPAVHYQWNPLTDDGDALRLAVKLDIVPRCINGVAFAWRDGVCDMQEPYSSEPCAAIRRAIVRAAAEIGKGVQ